MLGSQRRGAGGPGGAEYANSRVIKRERSWRPTPSIRAWERPWWSSSITAVLPGPPRCAAMRRTRSCHVSAHEGAKAPQVLRG